MRAASRRGENGSLVTESTRPSLLSSALATYATNVAVAVASLGNVLIVARTLGAEGRGAVAFLTTIGVLVSSLATLGVEQANANLAGRHPELRRALASNSLLLALVLGALGAAAVAGLVALVPAAGAGSSSGLRLLVLAMLPLLVLKLFADFLVRAEYGHGWANTAWLLEASTNVLVNGALALAGTLTVGLAVGVWLAGQALSAAVLVAFVALRGSGFGRPDAALLRGSVGFGLRAHAGRILTLGNYRLDQWLVGAFAGATELGHYSVAVAWSEALFFLPSAIVLAQRPDLVRATAEQAAAQVAAATRLAVLLTIPSAVVLVALAPFLCVGIFGEDFRGSIEDLRVLAWGGLGIVVLKLLGNVLTAQGRPLRASAGVAVAFALTVALDLLLIPRYGGHGAAIASTAAYTGGGMAIVVLFARASGLPASALVPRPADLSLVLRSVRRLVRA